MFREPEAPVGPESLKDWHIWKYLPLLYTRHIFFFYKKMIDQKVEMAVVRLAKSIAFTVQIEAVIPGAFEDLLGLADYLRAIRIPSLFR